MAASRKAPVFELYQDKKGEWRWRARSQNGKPLAPANEGYADKRDAVHCAKLFGYDPVAAKAAEKLAAEKAKAAAEKAAKAAAKGKPANAAAAPAKPKRVVKAKVAKPVETPPEG
jgi:uncharacterized protein YegP (UPF0339 family)